MKLTKADFRVGQLVQFGSTFSPTDIRRFKGVVARGVIVKLNPKKAKVKALDPLGKWPAGAVWSCPYSTLVPVVGGAEVTNEMTMKSFETPDDTAVKAWSEAQKSNPPLPKTMPAEDEHIMRAIHEIYNDIDDQFERHNLSRKITLLFRAIGREVSKEEAAEWCLAGQER